MVMQVIGWILLALLIAFGVFIFGVAVGVAGSLSMPKEEWLQLKEEWDKDDKNDSMR